VQGRLRKEKLTITIDTECAHCSQKIKIQLDSKMNAEIYPEKSSPLVFSPQIDWESFSAPNIIADF
jgi:hypothetical protein